MSQTDHKIILEEILNNNISVDSSKIEINSESIDHFELIMLHEIFENSLDLSLWYVLYSAVFYELL